MLIDAYLRQINYLRLSITDRCNFRCQYCMAEDMTFTPRQNALNADEFVKISRCLVELGIRKIRVTGGEPLVHPDFQAIILGLSKIQDLQTLAITTNGALLSKHIDAIAQANVGQLNISLDSLNPQRFAHISRTGQLEPVLEGISAAVAAGIPRIRLNVVLQKAVNTDEVIPLIEFAIEKNIHIAFIEEMPLGEIKRSETYQPHDTVIDRLKTHYGLIPKVKTNPTAGPARYYSVVGKNSVAGKQTEVGFISPNSCNFCKHCNRIRLTHEGRLLLCLGHETGLDLKPWLREQNEQALQEAIVQSIEKKPERHFFNVYDDSPQLIRFMNMTGG